MWQDFGAKNNKEKFGKPGELFLPCS